MTRRTEGSALLSKEQLAANELPVKGNTTEQRGTWASAAKGAQIGQAKKWQKRDLMARAQLHVFTPRSFFWIQQSNCYFGLSLVILNISFKNASFNSFFLESLRLFSMLFYILQGRSDKLICHARKSAKPLCLPHTKSQGRFSVRITTSFLSPHSQKIKRKHFHGW